MQLLFAKPVVIALAKFATLGLFIPETESPDPSLAEEADYYIGLMQTGRKDEVKSTAITFGVRYYCYRHFNDQVTASQYWDLYVMVANNYNLYETRSRAKLNPDPDHIGELLTSPRYGDAYRVVKVCAQYSAYQEL